MRIPIPYPHVKNMPDPVLVPKIKDRVPLETAEFFYGDAAPMFLALYNGYYTDCDEVVEFINEIYYDIMRLQPVAKTRKVDGFRYEMRFKNWVSRIAITFCIDQFNRKKEYVEFLDGLGEGETDPALKSNLGSIDRRDVDALLNAMPNKNYAELIRQVYLEEKSFDEAAEMMGIDDMNNFYAMHRRAKLQYVQVYKKEMER